MNLGEALKEAIQKSSYTVTEVAAALQIERSTFSAQLNTPGRLNPLRTRDIELVQRVAELIGDDPKRILETATGTGDARSKINVGLAKLLLKTLQSGEATPQDKIVAEQEILRMLGAA
jgi:hypothetical protein